MSPTCFRLVLAISMVTGLLGGYFDSLVPSAVPEALFQVQEKYETEPPLLLSITVVLVLFAWITSYIGLFLFRSWAPPLAIGATALVLAIVPALGADVASGYSTAFEELSSILWGAALAVAYSSPLKERFRATRLQDREKEAKKCRY